MDSSPTYCLLCKHEIETHNIAVQTDDSLFPNQEIIKFSSPGSSFTRSTINQMQKPLPCKGDFYESFINNESSFSLVSESSSINSALSYIKETTASSPYCEISQKIKNYNSKPASPSMFNKTLPFKSLTPKFYKKNFSFSSLDDSYEEMFSNIGLDVNASKLHFLQLIEVEKLSVRLQLKKVL